MRSLIQSWMFYPLFESWRFFGASEISVSLSPFVLSCFLSFTVIVCVALIFLLISESRLSKEARSLSQMSKKYIGLTRRIENMKSFWIDTFSLFSSYSLVETKQRPLQSKPQKDVLHVTTKAGAKVFHCRFYLSPFKSHLLNWATPTCLLYLRFACSLTMTSKVNHEDVSC